MENRQFGGIVNIGNQIFYFGDQWIKLILFRGTRGQLHHRKVFIFSSPEQSSRRAIVLPPASSLVLVLALAFVLASASTNFKSFMLKFLGPHYFQTL